MNPEHRAVIVHGVRTWNQWRRRHPGIRPDLGRAELCGADLQGIDLSGAELDGTDFSGANLSHADLSGANCTGAAHFMGTLLRQAKLCKADFSGSDLRAVDLSGADLEETAFCEANVSGATLAGANLCRADFHNADMKEADLRCCLVVETNMEGADLSGSSVYGVSAWNTRLNNATQSNLLITPPWEFPVRLDRLDCSQVVYLMLRNELVGKLIEVLTCKIVLILGRFTPERKIVLDAMRDRLRQKDYLPILFDFPTPTGLTTDETVNALAHLARFVIADITDAKCVVQELRGIVPDNPSLPVLPLILSSQSEPGMFDFFRKHGQRVLPPFIYNDLSMLVALLDKEVIEPAELMAKNLGKP
jgi:hypothetical protein